MIKPDGVRRGLVDEVVSRIRRAGLKAVSKKALKLDRRTAEKLYEVHRGKEFFERLIVHVIWGESVVMLVEGERAITRMREIVGATDWRKAASGTIRGDYGTSVAENVVHASDSAKSAKRELSLFFKI